MACTTGTSMTLARPRALSAVRTVTGTPAAGWPVTSAVPATSYQGRVRTHAGATVLADPMGSDLGRAANHNSIARIDAKASAVPAVRGGFGAKQAAPPRGVPR